MKIATINCSARTIEVCWQSGGGASFPFFWLRDHATDAVSYDSRSQQRELFTAALDPDIRPIDAWVTQGGSCIDVQWPDLEGTVRYSASFLERFATPRNSLASWKRAPWDATSVAPNDCFLEWQDFVHAGGLKPLMARLTEFGFAVMRNCPTNFDTISRIANTIGYVRQTIFGGMWEFEADEDMADSAYTPKELRPHTDGTYSHDAPGLQILMCCEYDAQGGESILVDGLRVAQLLSEQSPASFELLKQIPVMGRYAGDGVELVAQRPVFRTDHQGNILQVSFNNYDRAPFRLEDQLMEGFYRAITDFDRLANTSSLQWRHILKPGELLIFDNWRVMHGRGAFTGKRKMSGCYLNHEDMESCCTKLGLMHG